MILFQRLARHLPVLVAVVIILIFTLFGGLTGLALAQDVPVTGATAGVTFPHAQPSVETVLQRGIAISNGQKPAAFVQEGDDPAKKCAGCHADVYQSWNKSPHHLAYSVEHFQQTWAAQDNSPACLECHTTGFSPATEAYEAQGVSCTACHGKIASDHPKTPVDLSIANNACRNCHLVTFAEFRASLHEAKGLTCTTCHYAHENGLRLGEQVKQCLNCHGNQLTDFAHVSHVNAGLKCRHCHGYVEPGQQIPADGLVPTGHDFRESVRACVECHKDMKFAPVTITAEAMEGTQESGSPAIATQSAAEATEGPLESGSVKTVEIAELRAQLDTADLQSRNLTVTGLLYGGIGGLVIGGAVAWFVARRAGKSA